MTSRGARLVLAAAGLSFGAAALSWAAPALPEGLGAACAPDLVLRELLAGLAVFALLVAPSFLADEPGRPAECHDGLLAALAAAPAAVALAAAGGIEPADLLPAAVLVGACDLAASSYLRLDPPGKRGIAWAAGAAALLVGLPIAAYGIAEFGGWPGAAGAFRLSPLLAARDTAGGFAAAGPAILLLVGAAALLRFGAILRKVPAAALALVVLASPEHTTVLVVGAPREGDYAATIAGLKAKGAVVEEVDALPGALSWSVTTVVFARPPRSDAERASWSAAAADLVRSGRRAIPWPGGSVPASTLAPEAVLLRHPADRPEPGVDPGLFRIPFPVPPRSLPGTTLAFLGIVTLAMGGAVVVLRRRGRGGWPLGGLSAVGCGLLFLPGVLGGEFRIDRLVVEERVEGASSARRVEIVRVERLRRGGEDPVVAGPFTEIRFSADAEAARRPDGSVHLAEPGRFSLLAGVSGVETPPAAGPFLAEGTDPSAWKRSEDARVARAGWLIESVARSASRGSKVRFAVPAEGPDALVIHPR